jgi:predicted RNA polymerase sigma factor
VAAAEDALADAFLAALESWPRTGVPDKPEAWLLTAARRRLIDHSRHARVEAGALPALIAAADEAQLVVGTSAIFPDERLELLFICAHPAIDPAVRTPLMLQIVLRLDAARIASAFLIKPATMGQRLSRAKAKIRDARMRFGLPKAEELPSRLEAVMEAIYAAYGTGWDDVAGGDPRRRGLASKAIELGRLLRRLMPNEPEVEGLLALMLHCEARRGARRTAEGAYVPLSEQDATRWSQPMIAEAEELLSKAAQFDRLGRFQLEAAVQSVHAHRLVTGTTDWQAIAALYDGLACTAPTIGALVARAAAVAEAHGAARGWAILAEIPADAAEQYQPYWALAAHLLVQLERPAEAADAYDRAIGLSQDPATRDYLVAKRRRIS